MKQLTDKQKKAALIVAAVLLIIHFAPAMFHSLTVFGARKQVVLAPTRPQDPVGTPPQSKPVSSAAQAAPFMGTWQNDSLSPDNTRCIVHLEVRPSTEQPEMISGYEWRRCVNINQMPSNVSITEAANKSQPVATSMTGSYFEGAITFKVDNTVGSSPFVCAPVSYSVSPFGQRAIVAHWKGQGCPESQIILGRVGN